VGPGQRSSESLIRYRLGDAEATRRARWAAALHAASSMAPLALAVVLLHRLGWAPPLAFWAVAIAIIALIATRAAVGYARASRKLRALVVTVGEGDIHVESGSSGVAIARPRVARIVEIDGSLGGLRVESLPEGRSGVVSEARVPRGGVGYADVRARLESWHPIERRGRRGPLVRVAIGVAVVAGIFFIPFLLEDFVARSKVVAAGLVAGMWLVVRAVTRGR
jgi:hypothetical protein